MEVYVDIQNELSDRLIRRRDYYQKERTMKKLGDREEKSGRIYAENIYLLSKPGAEHHVTWPQEVSSAIF